MKKLLLIFLIPIFSFTQNGDTNGDGFVNLEDLFNVLENWLQEVNANNPESISNIDEMINVVDSLITINQNFDISKNTYFPEGLSSQIINHNFSQGEYVVPDGKRLYILNVQCDGGLFIDNLEIMYNVQSGQSNTLGLPIIINANQAVNIIEANGSFNGFLVDDSSNLEGITTIVEPNTYIVPDNKILFINHYYAGSLSVDNNAVWGLNYLASNFTFRLPTMVGAGQEVSCGIFGNDDTDCVINGYLVDENYFSSVSTSNSNNIQSSLENNISIQINDSDYYDFNDCNYINSLDYGSIVHNALQGLTAVVLPGKQCGSSPTSMFAFTNSGTNSFDTRDFLWCFSVNDTIALTSIPTLNSGGATRLYLLEDSLTNYDPNTDCEDDSDQFIYGSVQEVMWSLTPKEIILIPENVYGFRMDNNGSNNVFMYYGVSIQTTEAINNLGLWENQYPDYEWQLTNYFPLIGSPAYYPYGKSFKYF
ncbi:MAG: hypothetical protein VXY26_02465 [Bacteroidota bacterium]|nr:hypothetical protein [Bacteroidota bacterium]